MVVTASEVTRHAAAVPVPYPEKSVSVSWNAVAGMAARLLHAPVAVISAGDGRFLGTSGVPDPEPGARWTGPGVIADALVIADLAGHPLAAELGVRTLAAVPLRDERQRPVGAITLLDRVPRAWPEPDLAVLAEIAATFGPPLAAGSPSPDLAALTGSDDAVADGPDGARRGFIAALLDSVPIGVVAVDADRRPMLFNRTMRRFCGLGDDLSPADAMAAARPLLHHLDGRPVEVAEMAVTRALGGDRIRDVEAVLHVPGMPDRFTLTNGEPIRGLDGSLLGAVGTVSDVTERYRRERFHECERRVARLLAEAGSLEDVAPRLLECLGRALDWPHVVLFLVDEVADVLRTAAYWSAPGIDVDDLVPERIPPGDAGPGLVWATGRPAWIPDLTAARFTETPAAYAFARAAAERGLRASLTVPIRDGDRVLGVLASLRSTCEHDEFLLTGLVDGFAAQLGQFLAGRRSRELTMQLDRTRDDFLTLVGHELRTPLTSIISYTTLLADEIDDPDRQQMIAAIHRNIGHLQRIIDDLLELSALEAGHFRLRRRHVDLAAMVAAAVAAVEVPPGLRLHTGLPPRLMLSADPDRLRQIVDQLLSNAVKYSPGGGDIRITADGSDPDVAELVVTDTGIGIPDEDRERLFARFHRGGNARHTAIPGHGLGLPLARGLVAAHGGTIALDPSHHPGTRIVVRLPRAAPSGPVPGH